MGRLQSAAAFMLLIVTSTLVAAEPPEAISEKGATVVFEAHAEGAQIYQCKADASGKAIWQFREPIASLFEGEKTVGRHYSGPTWEIGGSVVKGKLASRAPGTTAKDIPWLKLEIIESHGDGPLKGATTVQRINTIGGNLEGACDKAGELRSEPYAADYVFLKK